MDHVEVRYVAAGSGSNTTDRLLTIDKSETSPPSLDQTDPDLDHLDKQEVPQINSDHNSHCKDNNANKQNHNNSHEPHLNCHPVSAPKIQKVSIV